MKKLECFFDVESIINQCITVKNRKLPEMGTYSYCTGSETGSGRKER